LIYKGMPAAKAVAWNITNIEERRRREQTGLDTLVVYAVKDECQYLVIIKYKVNTLSIPPGEYDRKIGTQRN
jgi:hypothetical protein